MAQKAAARAKVEEEDQRAAAVRQQPIRRHLSSAVETCHPLSRLVIRFHLLRNRPPPQFLAGVFGKDRGERVTHGVTIVTVLVWLLAEGGGGGCRGGGGKGGARNTGC